MKNLLVFFGVMFSVVSWTQRYNFVQLTVDDGLSQSQVRDICQDQNGYLWVGTKSGLCRYDGNEFVNFSKEDGLSNNSISELTTDSKGDLWIATSSGLTHFSNQTFTPYYFDEPYRIRDIIEFQGEIYLASNTGLIRFKNGTFERLGSEYYRDQYLRSLANAGDSLLYMGSKEGGVITFDGTNFGLQEIPEFPSLNIRSVEVYENVLYLSVRNVGLISYDLYSGEVNDYELRYPQISSFFVAEDLIFGITLDQGVFLIDDSGTRYFGRSNSNLSGDAACLFRDAEGNIWIGTDGSGLMKFLEAPVVSYTQADGLGSDLILSIEQDTAGAYYFGSYDLGVTKMKGDEITLINQSNEGLPDQRVWTIEKCELGNIWMGTSRGLIVFDESLKVVPNKLADQGEKPKIRTMVHTEYGTVTGGDEGIWMVTTDSARNVHEDLDITKLVVAEDKLYAATNGGLYTFDFPNFTNKNRINVPEDAINTITLDLEGNLWIGTENDLYVMLKSGRVVPFPWGSQKRPLAKSVLGLITAKDGSIWLSGMNGVSKIEVIEKKNQRTFSIRNYKRSDGLINRECNINAIYEDDRGYIWVGTSGGLVEINPNLKDQLSDYNRPQLHIKGIRLFTEDFPYRKYASEFDSVLGVPTKIELPYYENHITFDFVGINLKDPNAVIYEYRMIGAGEDWLPMSKEDYTTYTLLPPGSYTFQVRAANKNEQWSEIKEVDVVITPPFWKTWWFITLSIIGGVVIVLRIFNARINALKQQQENAQLDMKNRLLFLEQRSLNASMNRHFIFNSLNSIQYFINSSDKRSANRFLSNFAKLIRKNLDSSAANNFIVTLQEEVERIELYLSLEKMRFSDKFEYTVNVSSALDTESIEIPSMILQPFVENSIIHGVLSLDRVGEIQVNITEENGEVIFEVVDNGIGIDISLSSKGESMEGDHESKGVEITNRRIEILRRLTGENLAIIGPLQMNDENGKSMGTKVILKLGLSEKF